MRLLINLFLLASTSVETIVLALKESFTFVLSLLSAVFGFLDGMKNSFFASGL